MASRPLNKRYALMLRWGLPSLLVTAALSGVVIFSNARDDPMAPNADGSIAGLTSILARTVTPEMVRFSFKDVTEEVGIHFVHFPATRQSLLPEDMGSGLAWGDYNNSGYPDLFIVNFRGNLGETADPSASNTSGRCSLYRNDGPRSPSAFTVVSAESGADLLLHGMAAAWGDYNNNGFLDLYVTAYGENVLLHNNRDGTFSDVTHDAGVGDDSFSAGCAWADFNNNGWLDLYVCNYVHFTDRPTDGARQSRQYGSEIPYTINPSAYRPAANKLYRNNGPSGTFTDVARDCGTDNPSGRSLQAVWFDFNNDGNIDLYVANDISANGVFLNMADETFADIGASSLAADYRGAMGMAVGDYNHSGFLDLFITHWIAQENILFENMTGQGWKKTGDAGEDSKSQPRIFFMEVGEMLGLGQSSLRMVGWATSFADFDNDGYVDLWVANGHTLQDSSDTTQLRPQELQVFQHEPGKGFFDVAQHAWAQMRPGVGRGGAHADFDQDGRLDFAFLTHGGGVTLLRNDSDAGNWITLRLRQKDYNTHAIGARVELRSRLDGKAPVVTQTAQVMAGGSYLSQDFSDLHFGLGKAMTVDELVIHWPDGAVEVYTDLPANQRSDFTHTPSFRQADTAH